MDTISQDPPVKAPKSAVKNVSSPFCTEPVGCTGLGVAGALVGRAVGTLVGVPGVIVGRGVGGFVGLGVGRDVGRFVGLGVGRGVGLGVGRRLGDADGPPPSLSVGDVGGIIKMKSKDDKIEMMSAISLSKIFIVNALDLCRLGL